MAMPGKRALMTAMLTAVALPAAAQDDPAEQNAFRDRVYLTGAWGGLRPSLAERGLTIDAAYTLELLWNVRGGIDTGRAARSNLTITFEWDTEKAGAWDGGLFGLEVQTTQGAGLSEKIVGDFQSLSNLDAEDFTRVSQLWYRHTFADGRLWLQIGKQDANAEIGAVNYTGGFFHSSAGLNPTAPIVSYPDYDLGILAAWAPNDRFTLKLGLFGGDPDGGRSVSAALDNLRDPIVYAEAAWSYAIKELPGTVRLGHWWAAGAFDVLTPAEKEPTPFERYSALQEAWAALGAEEPVQPAPPTPERLRVDRILSLTDGIGELHGAVTELGATLRAMSEDTRESGTHGFYANWDQALYRENPSDEDDAQGLGVFAHYGWADADVSEAEHFVGAGLEWTGPIPGRDADVLGLGVFHVRFSRRLGLAESDETAAELYYIAQITPFFAIQPDIQYIVNPGGSDSGDALVLGLRTTLRF